MKQITIYDLLPLLKSGYVAMDADGRWFWHNRKPILYQGSWHPVSKKVCLCECFDIVFFDGDWKDSLIKIADSQKDTNKFADSKSENRVYKKNIVLTYGLSSDTKEAPIRRMLK